MMKLRALSAVIAATSVALAASVAFAQGAPAIPVAEEPEGYPTELVDRPIIYPYGFEFDGSLATSTNDVVDLFDEVGLNLGGRFGNGRLEVFGSADILAKQPDGADLDTLQAITGGAAFELGPDQVLRGSLSIILPTNDTLKIIDAAGVFQIKRKLAPKIALVASGGVDFVNFLPDPEAPDPIWLMSAVATGEAQVQVAPKFAVAGQLAALVPLAHSPDELDPENVFNVGAFGLLSLAPNVDAYGGFQVRDAFDDADRLTVFTAGGLARL